MKCPSCGGPTKVRNSRSLTDTNRPTLPVPFHAALVRHVGPEGAQIRRRVCVEPNCRKQFTTAEVEADRLLR